MVQFQAWQSAKPARYTPLSANLPSIVYSTAREPIVDRSPVQSVTSPNTTAKPVKVRSSADPLKIVFRREQKGSLRRRINAAQDKAIIRICPRPSCSIRLKKDGGCNELHCSRCDRYMCNVCRADLGDSYSHGHFHRDSTCRQFPETGQTDDDRDARERNEAEETTIKEFLEERPELVFEEVKKFIGFGYDYSTLRKSPPAPPGTIEGGKPTLQDLNRWEEALRTREKDMCEKSIPTETQKAELR